MSRTIRHDQRLRRVSHPAQTEVYIVWRDGSLGPMIKVFTGKFHRFRAAWWCQFVEVLE